MDLYLRTGLAAAVELLVLFVIGGLLQPAADDGETSVCETILSGFVTMLAALEAAALPSTAAGITLSAFFMIWAASLSLLIAASCVLHYRGFFRATAWHARNFRFTPATMLMVMLGRRISIRGRMLIRESMNTASLSDLGSLTKLYLLLSVAIELIGAVLLSLRFVPLFGWKHGIWMALFHSVSAFCNAGFDLFGSYASLTAFSGDPLVLLTVAALVILGGLGFSVILEAFRNRQGFRNLSLHTRIVLMTTLGLLLAGTLFFWLAERTHTETLAGRGEGEKILNAFFQSVTLRTAGFNSFDLSGLRDGSKLFSSLLMMIGASPASTGGGIKTTTIATLTLLMLSVIRGESEVNVARRRLSDDIVRRALAVTGLFMIVLLTGTLMISFIEGERFPLEDVLFEASSAMGTVGVSAIGTPNLSAASQAVLLPMMFLGRVGPLTLAVAVAKRQGGIRTASKYPEEKIMIG